MPILDRALERIPLFRGQKSGNPPQAIEAADSTLLQNCILLQNQLKKVNGTSTYAQLKVGGVAVPTANTTPWLDYYLGRWWAQNGNKIFRETAEGSATFDVSTIGETDKVFSEKYALQMFLANGRHLYRSDESGGTPPPWALTSWGLLPALGEMDSDVLNPGDGGSMTVGKYYYCITLYDSLSGLESIPANGRPADNGLFVKDPFAGTAFSISGSEFAPTAWTVTLVDAETQVTFPFAEIHKFIAGQYVDARADTFNLYRTDVNADVFKLQSSNNIAAFIAAGSPLVDKTADSALGSIIDVESPTPNVDRMVEAQTAVLGITPPASSFGTYKFVRVFKDVMFGIGHYGLGAQGGGPSSFPPFDSVLNVHDTFRPEEVFTQFNINQGDGQKPTCLAILKDQTLIIFKNRSIYYLLGTSVDNYSVRILDSKRGCVSASTVQETTSGIYALDASGIININSFGQAQPVSNPDINDIIQRINFNQISNSYSGYDPVNEIYFLAVPVDGSSVPNLQIAYSIRSGGFTTLQGVEGSSLHFDFDPSGNALSMIGSRQQGHLLNWANEQQVTFLNNPVVMQYESGPMYMGDPSRRKKARFLYITAESAQDFTVDVDIIIDYSQTQTFSLTGINSGSIYSVYASSLVDDGVNVGVFDESYWGSDKTQKQIKIPIYGVGYVFQVRITNSESNPAKYGFKIQAIEFEGVMMGR